MKFLKLAFLLLLILSTATGCWGNREVQNVNYPSAIGVDYEGGNYTVYVQLLDFSSVAKLEGQQKQQEAPVWVGKGVGPTFTDAANYLYETSQQRVTWGHVEAIVFSERILEQNKYNEVLELINRYREIRYLIWAFSTKEPIYEVFRITPFFRLSPEASILHNPEEVYRQRSMIRPVRLYQFIMSIKEKVNPAYLPCLTIDQERWEESNKKHPLLKYDGMHIFQYKKFVGHMNLTDLKGLPWMREDTVRMPLSVRQNDHLVAILITEKPHVHIRHAIQDGKVYFDVTVSMKAGINEQHMKITEKELSKLAGEEVEEEIRYTYKKAYERGVDIYNLAEELYRSKPAAFHRLADENQFVLNENSLRNVRVKVHLTSTGRYKFEPGTSHHDTAQ